MISLSVLLSQSYTLEKALFGTLQMGVPHLEVSQSLAELAVPAARPKIEVKPDVEGDDDEEEQEEQWNRQQSRGPTVKKGSECPYLDTISRQV